MTVFAVMWFAGYLPESLWSSRDAAAAEMARLQSEFPGDTFEVHELAVHQ